MSRSTQYGRGGAYRRGIFAAVALAILALTASRVTAGLPVQSDPVLEARVDSLMRAAVDHVYAGRLDLGLRTVDLAEEIAPRDPRVALTRYRLLRENYPTGMYEKSRAQKQAPPLLAELEHAIAICDSMLEIDEDKGYRMTTSDSFIVGTPVDRVYPDLIAQIDPATG